MQKISVLSPQMRLNVEAILNPSESKIKKLVAGLTSNIKITETPKATCYYIDVVFHNDIKKNLSFTKPIDIIKDTISKVTSKEKETRFDFTPHRINSFRIEQNFVENYMNHYELNVMLTPAQYQKLFYNYKDLRCTVKFYAANINTSQIFGKTFKGDPILVIEDAYCVFKDKQDIMKKNPKSTLIPENENAKNTTHQEQYLDNIIFQIMPKEDYQFRSADVNTILNNCTVKDAIYAIANSAESVDALMCVDPDNKTVYKNIVIPPILSISDALTFLQQYYGIYSKGLGFYYQVGCLYVYPQFETSPILPKDKAPDVPVYKKNKYATVTGDVLLDEMGDGGMTHIYMVGEDNYTGLQYYHAFEGKTIHIVSNGKAVFRDLADAGMENVGYGFLAHHSSRDIDSARTVLDSKIPLANRFGIWPMNIHQNPNNSYLAQDGQNKELGMTSTLANVQYVDDKSNIFTLQSMLNSYKRNTAGFVWNNAVPFTFRPGYRICYHYDGEDESRRGLDDSTAQSLQYMTKDGVVDEVTYTFSLSKSSDPEFYTCMADVGVSLEVDKTNHIDGI